MRETSNVARNGGKREGETEDEDGGRKFVSPSRPRTPPLDSPLIAQVILSRFFNPRSEKGGWRCAVQTSYLVSLRRRNVFPSFRSEAIMMPSRLKTTISSTKRHGEGDTSSPYPNSYGSVNIFSSMSAVTLL